MTATKAGEQHSSLGFMSGLQSEDPSHPEGGSPSSVFPGSVLTDPPRAVSLVAGNSSVQGRDAQQVGSSVHPTPSGKWQDHSALNGGLKPLTKAE